MDWQIKSFVRRSTLTGEPFADGDRVVSLVYLDEESGEGLGRADLLEGEVDGFAPAGAVLGRWTRTVKDEAAEEGGSAAQQVQSAEELLFSLLEAPAEAEAGEERAALVHLLALMLERKRLLKRIGTRSADGVQRYRHREQDREIEIPVVDIAPATLLQLRETFGEIIT